MACRIERTFTVPIHPVRPSYTTPHHAHCFLINIWKGEGGKEGPVLSLYFLLLSGDYCLGADIYPYIFWCFGLNPVSPYLSFIIFSPFFGLLELNVNIDWPHTLPIHWLSLFVQ